MTELEEFVSAGDRRAMVEANRALAAAGQSDLVCGHVGVRVGGNAVLMKVSGPGFEEIGDVQAVVRTHSIAAAAFASMDEPLRPLADAAVPFLDPDVPRFTRTGDLLATPQLGAELANCLGDHNGCLIPGHGTVTVGRSLGSAVMHAALLDRARWVQLEAMAAGGPRRRFTDAEVARKRAGLWSEGQLRAGYDYLVRRGHALAESIGHLDRECEANGRSSANPRC